MRALRSFHFPSSSHGSYAEAHLTISGLGAWFFPPSPCRTLVRTLPVLNSDGQRTGAVKWLRSFGGETFVASVHTYPDEQRGSKDAASSTFHPVEEMFPLQITFDWERSQSHDNGGGDDDGRVLVAPRFVGVFSSRGSVAAAVADACGAADGSPRGRERVAPEGKRVCPRRPASIRGRHRQVG